MKIIPLLLTAVVFAACSSPPPPVRPALEEQAIAWNQRGQDAWRRGDLTGALDAYEEAYRAWAAMDRSEAAAGELLNLATVHYRLGHSEAARRELEQVLSAAAVSAPMRADAAYRRAHIDFDAGDNASASQWLERSAALCADCPVAGRRHNLRARMLLAQGDDAGAAMQAQRALELNRSAKDVTEEANALRLLAQVALGRQQYTNAEAHYVAALVIDRDSAEPHKIVANLLGLARCALAQGRRAAANDYARRAQAAAESIGDGSARAQAAALMADAQKH